MKHMNNFGSGPANGEVDDLEEDVKCCQFNSFVLFHAEHQILISMTILWLNDQFCYHIPRSSCTCCSVCFCAHSASRSDGANSAAEKAADH